MKKLRGKDVFTIICTMASIVTSIVIISTFLTMYQFLYVGQKFNSYFMIQFSVAITMMLWAIRFFVYRKGREKYIYSGICLLISLMFIFFTLNIVK